MSAPRNEVVQVAYQNPHASMPLMIPVLVVCNTADEDLERNIRANSAREDVPWIAAKPEHDGVGVFVGGGPSAEDDIETIRQLAQAGATVFAMNAASQWLRKHNIAVDYQVIADAKPETSTLVDPYARAHLLASQVHELTFNAALNPHIWHLELGEIERFLPPERVRKGGYALIGGGAAVGNSALCLAYAMGWREMHIFGFDSCHRDGRSHAYAQPMNQFIPSVDVSWGGRVFHASVAMKAQAEKFQITAQALKQMGCRLHVYGDGLLQTMYRTPATDLNERDRYRRLWQFDGYREYSPGEMLVDKFLKVAKPHKGTLIVDFGCGTGRAALALSKLGHHVMLTDFADNCRDDEALPLPFLEWDLTQPCPLRAPTGLCTDVMEHIPTDKVDTVIANIMQSARRVFFQVATRPDVFGTVIGVELHHTVKPHEWWAERFAALGYFVAWQENATGASCFLVTTAPVR